MLQAVLNVSQQQQRMERCDLPDGVVLPLQTIKDLRQQEKKLKMSKQRHH